MEFREIEDIFDKFDVEGDIIGITYFSNGLINTSCKVTVVNDGKVKEYVLQKINKNVFKKPEEVMENISRVTNHIKNKLEENGESTKRRVLKFYKAKSRKYYNHSD